jgi:two-component system CheB/CheR fusion protein
VRILPYAIPSTTGRGAVMSFVDVSAYHDAKRLQAILDGLPEHVAVVESDGTIRLVNAAWKRFAIANGDAELKTTGPGCNYLSACKSDLQLDGESATAALRGLRGVLEGTLPGFSIEYPCHSPTEQRWFVMNVAPIQGPTLGAVVSHINVTAWFRRTEE